MASKCFALTGGIATGKSFILKEFRRQGFKTIDCDSIVASLYRNETVKRKLRKEFGTANKKGLGGIVFASPSKRKKLEFILHPIVLRELRKRLSALKKQKKPVVVDVPLFFESRQPFHGLFSGVSAVRTTKKQQLARLAERGFSKKEALQRINSQMPLVKKLKKSDYIINNTKSKPFTIKQVRLLAKKLGDF